MHRRLTLVLAAAVLCGCAAGPQPGAQAPQPDKTGATPNPAAAQTLPVPGPAQAPPDQQRAQPPTQPAPNAQGRADLDMASTMIGTREALAFRVPFSPGTATFKLSPDAARALAVIALRAEKIQLRELLGGDPAKYALELWDERMRVVRTFLVDNGVAADRIEIVKPAGNSMRSNGNGGGAGNPMVEVAVLLAMPGSAR
ncbi:MAG TPA: hypothetical protein VIM12_15095 [Noviherbaspirillum sp.]|uniref:hypothetical protein n=1 Tax=Noviherbaspirillum sp. TaxID=1926288 RepID=UPI002F95EE37